MTKLTVKLAKVDDYLKQIRQIQRHRKMLRAKGVRQGDAPRAGLTLKMATEEEFFRRGRALARAADRGERLLEERIVSFEDPLVLAKLITPARIDLIRAVKRHPGSITQIAVRLHRDRSAVTRDVAELARVGLVTVEEKVLPGHGRMKEIRAAAEHLSVQAVVM